SMALVSSCLSTSETTSKVGMTRVLLDDEGNRARASRGRKDGAVIDARNDKPPILPAPGRDWWAKAVCLGLPCR
ncbi:MAG: hypothetical protein ACN6P8_16260, partial [Achromobacter piechaudii]